MGGVVDEGNARLAAFADQPRHARGPVRPDDDGGRLRRGVGQPDLSGAVHSPAVVAGDLVVVEVGGGEAGGGRLALQQLQAAAVDAEALEPTPILGGIGTRSREDRARLAQQRQRVGVVGGDAAPPPLEAVDQEAQVQDVDLVGHDVVAKAAVEGEDVIEGDRPGRQHGARTHGARH
jgi:hypothetical protein